MSAVIAAPELMAQAATDLAAIGDTLNAAHRTAAVPTAAVLPAAADEVSTSISHLFSGYGQGYQKLAGESAASYEQFTQHLAANAGAYASAEAANVSLLTADAAASTTLLDPFINFALSASQLITLFSENPAIYVGVLFVLGALLLPFVLAWPVVLLILLLELPSLLLYAIGWL